MRPHHRATLDAAAAHFNSDPQVLALVFGGSVAKGLEREDSDIDVMVVLTPEAYAERRRHKTYATVIWELSTYEGGYVDVKFMDLAFLEAAAVRASEPTRDAFTCAQVVWSHIPDLDAVVKRIPVYPEAERETKMRRFYSAAVVQNFFIREAEKRKDPFLLMQASSSMALFAGRLILAYNRVLFPSNKRFMERVASVPDQPNGFVNQLESLLLQPSVDQAKALTTMLNDFRDWGVTWNDALGQFVEDCEFNWLDNPPPLGES